MKLAVAFDLPFDPVEQVALELLHASASKTCHVHVISLRSAFVEMAFALHMQQVELVHEPVPFQQRESAIDGDPIDLRIDAGGFPQDLGGVQVLIRCLDNFKNNAALMGESYSSCQQRGL